MTLCAACSTPQRPKAAVTTVLASDPLDPASFRETPLCGPCRDAWHAWIELIYGVPWDKRNTSLVEG